MSACNEENIDEIVPDEPTYQPESTEVNNLLTALRFNDAEGLDLDCITILFPFDLELASGNTVSINSESEFNAAIDSSGTDPAVNFIFPLDILNSDGENEQINTLEELGAAFIACIPTDGWDYSDTEGDLIPAFAFDGLCFDLVYPVNLEDADGNTYTANDEAALIDLSATVENLFFVLPITVLDEDDNEIVIEDYDAFFFLVETCENSGITPPIVVVGGIEIVGFACYELQYPFTLDLGDGNTLEINDEDEYATTILNAGEALELVYPFTLQSILDSQLLTINNGDEYLQALAACGIDIEIEEDDDPCDDIEEDDPIAHTTLFYNAYNIFALYSCPFTFEYPVQLDIEGTVFDINNVDDYLAAIGGNPFTPAFGSIVFPVTVIKEDDTTEELNSNTDVCVFINSCE